LIGTSSRGIRDSGNAIIRGTESPFLRGRKEGKERKGKERKGKERKGKERK
jgi:hypothetical protein